MKNSISKLAEASHSTSPANSKESVFNYGYCCLCRKFQHEIVIPECACISCLEALNLKPLFESLDNPSIDLAHRAPYVKTPIACYIKGSDIKYDQYESLTDAAKAHRVAKSLVSLSSIGKYQMGVLSRTLNCRVYFAVLNSVT